MSTNIDPNRFGKVLPGQKIVNQIWVTGPPAIVGNPTYQWEIGGDIFLDYQYDQNSSTLTERPTAGAAFYRQRAVTFYWYSPEAETCYTVVCDVQLAGAQHTVELAYYVVPPTGDLTAVNPGKGVIGLYADQPRYGLKTPVKFKGKVAVPAGFAAGKWYFVQLVKPHREQILANGTHQAWSENDKADRLDVSVPYKIGATPNADGLFNTGPTEGSVEDAPNITIDGLQSASASDSFETYLMFSPWGAGDRYVPLKVVRWNWKGGILNGPTFEADVTGGKPDLVVGDPGNTNQHPKWTKNNKNGAWV
jgi:hypothetical protein